MVTAVQAAQIAFAVAEFAADIGDDDIEAQEPFEEAFEALTTTHPESLQDAAARLRCMAQIGTRYAGCEGIGENVRRGILMLATWLDLTTEPIGEARGLNFSRVGNDRTGEQ
ncbi:MAG: hypothetical protein B7Z40_00910 [Bosea sp. 12-68-7]|nr:MAG: hypothetical protein B7Z40_00910 [Bosea sp. 12-68-7]